MEEYWQKFMNSGAVEDYLQYKGMELCGRTMETYVNTSGKMGERKRGADNSDRNGSDSHSDGGI